VIQVRYYACESLYNIAKVARGKTLPYFTEIFDGLCKVLELKILQLIYDPTKTIESDSS
jgi:hypothetical protein